MKNAQEFMGLQDFVWFVGVVEDRKDPLNAGRVRVRCYGWHSESRTEVPIDALPWAQVMTPITNAAMTGIGQSATGMVEGTTVVGFFMDGRNGQYPIIMGTLPGIPVQGAGRGEKGFGDKNALYPLASEVGYPDTPRLAYDRYTLDPITKDKDKTRVEDVATASAPELTRTSRLEAVEAGKWSEPAQRGGASAYPYNKVFQTESGHAFEIDDTVGGERIHEYHRTGTFYEIQPDGSKITKVVGDNYEITVGDDNVLISGACNVTIKGDARLLIEGNYIEEIGGDFRQTIHGSRNVKVGGNDALEVVSARSHSIGENDSKFVGGNDTNTVTTDSIATVGGTIRHTVGEDVVQTYVNDFEIKVGGVLKILSAGQMDIGAGENLNLATDKTLTVKSIQATDTYATALNIHNDQNVTGTSTASVDHVSNGISGHNHTHGGVQTGGGNTGAPQ